MRVSLPEPWDPMTTGFLEVIRRRRSVRSFRGRPLDLDQISYLCYCTYGETAPGKRAAPSAGACYPLELYLCVMRVEGLELGLYHYVPDSHSLLMIRPGDFSEYLIEACWGQEYAGRCPASFILTLHPERTEARYGKRGLRYALLDAGAAGQNLHLAAPALGLGTVMIGAFSDEALRELVGGLPVLIMPVGYPG